MIYPMPITLVRYRLHAVFLFVFLGVSSDLLADSGSVVLSDVANEGLRRQEQTQDNVLRSLEQSSSVLVPSLYKDNRLSLSKERQCFNIDETEVLSDKGFSWIKEEISYVLKGCIGVNNIKQVLRFVNDKLIEKGFVTSRLSLPEQNIKSGKIIFKVYSGSVEGVVFSDEYGDSKLKLGESFVLPFEQGDLLNLRDLEQGTENINRLKSQQVKVEIKPGDKPGGSVIVLNRTQDESKRIRGGITASNAGNRSVSRTQASAYVTAENLLGVAGILNISANSNLENVSSNNFSQSLSTRYNVPVGYASFNVSHSYTRFSQVVSGTTARFISSGSSHKWRHRYFSLLLKRII